MVKECKAQGVMIVLGSDSHVDADIAEYPYAEEILRETEFSGRIGCQCFTGKN